MCSLDVHVQFCSHLHECNTSIEKIKYRDKGGLDRVTSGGEKK